MKKEFLQYAQCFSCASDFDLEISEVCSVNPDEIMSGFLRCASCEFAFPIVRGVPRILPKKIDPGVALTSENFGNEWTIFNKRTDAHTDQLENWLQPLPQGFLKGKRIIDFGCGMGRNPLYFAENGAEVVVGIDVSHAVDAAFENTKHLKNIHIVQADIYHPPTKRSFDFGFSLGVLHHLPDPRKGFGHLVSVTEKGATIFVWVYGLENNNWIVKWITPFREKISSRMSPRVLKVLSYFVTCLLYFLIHFIYFPISKILPNLSKHLFYRDYLLYNSHYSFSEVHLIVYDHLTAPIAHYISREEIGDWFVESGVRLDQVIWHNKNSWTAIGCK